MDHGVVPEVQEAETHKDANDGAIWNAKVSAVRPSLGSDKEETVTPIETLDRLEQFGTAHVEAVAANDWDHAKDIVVERHKLLSGVLDGLVDDSRALHAIAAKLRLAMKMPDGTMREYIAEALRIADNKPSRPVGPKG